MRYQSWKLNLIYYYYYFLQNGFKQRKNSQLFLKKSPRKLNKSLQALSGICHFDLEKLQMPHGGAQKYSANSLSWDNTKIVFSSK